ncbi:hypothetical protein MIFENG_48 [Hafnia phage vB_HpaM_Meifeng]|nr:hypothetical protein MIFENG_48 [Hafnia phage vB_HpaM_Meifeng]
MRKVTIRYKNRSMSQFSRVKLVFDDGWNTFFYDEEGAPFVISNQAYERLCDGWPDTQNEVKFITAQEQK